MADAQSQAPFVPKQCYPKTAELYAEIVGDSSTNVASIIVQNLLPPFIAESVIHDNGCGTGEALSQVMASNPPPGIKIFATDRNQYMIDACRAKAEEHGWPVEASVMRAQELTFPDNSFTTSFSNFFVAHLDNGHKASSNIYRTLRPGGTAVVSELGMMAHMEPLQRAHAAIRKPDVILPMSTDTEWFQPSTLQRWLVDGGFQESNIKMESVDTWVETKDLRHWVTITWSFLGARDDGWKQEDEENWDKAIDTMLDGMETSEHCVKSQDGSTQIRLRANVALAVK